MVWVLVAVLFLHLWSRRIECLGSLSFHPPFPSCLTHSTPPLTVFFFITIIITANDGVSVSMFILDVTSVIVLFIFPPLVDSSNGVGISIREARDHEACGRKWDTYRNWYGGATRASEDGKMWVLERTGRLFLDLDFFFVWLLNFSQISFCCVYLICVDLRELTF